MSTCISCMNTRDPPGKRGGTAIQLQLVLPLCLLPRVLLRQPELLRIFILHLHCTFPLLFSYCCLIFYPPSITISACFSWPPAPPSMFSSSHSASPAYSFSHLPAHDSSHSTPATAPSPFPLLSVSLFISSPANFLSGHVANVANLLPSARLQPRVGQV